MTLATKKYQDWSAQECLDLRAQCIAQWPQIMMPHVRGVYGIGSRAMGFHKADSDADVVILLEDCRNHAAWKDKIQKTFTFQGITVEANLYGDQWKIMRDQSSYAPMHNLLTQETEWHPDYTTEEHVQFVNDWLNFKIAEGVANGYDFLEGRDLSQLIVERL